MLTVLCGKRRSFFYIQDFISERQSKRGFSQWSLSCLSERHYWVSSGAPSQCCALEESQTEDLKGIILVSELLKLGEISRTFDRKGCLEIEQRFAGSVGPRPGFYNGLNCGRLEI